MGLIDDKKSIFTTIGAYTSLNESPDLPDNSNLFPSVSNKKEIIPFLLDILKVVIGSTALQDLTGELLTNLTDKAEPTLKESATKQFIQYNAGQSLPSYFVNTGISIPIKSFDIFGKLKTDPASETGSLLFDDNTPNFDSQVYSALQSNGGWVTYNNIQMSYDSSSDSMTFKPTSALGNIGEWFSAFILDTSFINKTEFVTNVLNAIYGTISTNQDKTPEEIFDELQVTQQLEQVSNGDDSFEISQDVLDQLFNTANQMSEGVVTYDLGCGLVEASLSLDDLSNTVNEIADSTDPFAVGNAMANTVNSSFEGNEEVGEENSDTIKDGFFSKIIQAIKLEFIKVLVASPQMRVLFAIFSAFTNNGEVQTGDPKEDQESFKTVIKCLIKEILAIINEFIFNLVLTELLAIIKPVITRIIREKIIQYIGVIRSLIGV
jgi:hypothetical protein